MYLKEDEGKGLFQQIVSHFSSAEFVFGGLSKRGIRMQKFNKAIRAARATVFWASTAARNRWRSTPGSGA